MTTTDTTPAQSRTVTMHGSPLTLAGRALAAGHKAPPFTLTTSDLKPFTLDDALSGGTRSALLVVVPSLDTPVCSLETQTFHRRLSDLPASAAAFIVSRDLPFAQARWAEANDATKLTYLSDYKDHAFGRDYGVTIEQLGVLARAIFVIGKNGTINVASIVPEVSAEPDYDEVFASVGRVV